MTRWQTGLPAIIMVPSVCGAQHSGSGRETAQEAVDENDTDFAGRVDRDAWMGDLGGPAPKNKPKARKAGPLTCASNDAAPFLIMHGDKDNVVPLQQSALLAGALKKAGVEVTLQVIQGNGHGGPGFNSPESRKLIENFFAKHLGKERR